MTMSSVRGAWDMEEDRKLAQSIEIYGPRRWKSLAIKAGLNRCGKSCRLRWLNYLKPDIKRGNISLAEDDLILRLHRLLGNRWSLIARRLPGRTDNEIKNYWNSHLSKKAYLMKKLPATPICETLTKEETKNNHPLENNGDDEKSMERNETADSEADYPLSSDGDEELFDFSTQGTNGLEWVKHFLQLEGDP